MTEQVMIKSGSGFWKGIWTALKSPFKIIGWILGMLFSSKWKISFSVLFIVLFLFSALSSAIKEKDYTIVFKDVGGKLIASEYNLNKEITEKPVELPNLKEGKIYNKIWNVMKFFWDSLKIIGLLWFIFMIIYLFYLFIGFINDKSKQAINLTGAIMLYSIIVMVGSYYLFHDLRLPFQSVYELGKQIIYGAGNLNINTNITSDMDIF